MHRHLLELGFYNQTARFCVPFRAPRGRFEDPGERNENRKPISQDGGKMKTNAHFAHSFPRRKIGVTLAVGLPTLLIALPLIGAERGGGARAAMSAPRPAMVDRFSHGSIRHVDT